MNTITRAINTVAQIAWVILIGRSRMRCDTRVTYYIPRGYDYAETSVSCGGTDWYGEQRFCDNCLAKGAAQSAADIADNDWLKSAGMPPPNLVEVAGVEPNT